MKRIGISVTSGIGETGKHSMWGGIWNNLRNYIVKNWYLIFEICLLVLICLLHAVSAGHYSDFHPIDGTMQNYNPVRRLLSGQVPYEDFQDYLGMGHLYLGAVFTVLFGGSYRSSLMAFSFLNFFSIALISVMICRSIFRKWTSAVGLTDLLLVILLMQPVFYVNGLGIDEDIVNALNYSVGLGNSVRFVRGMVLPISMALVGLLYRLVQKHSERIAGWKHGWTILPAGTGLIAGFSFVWSNDYGISCFVCICLMTFFLSWSRHRKLLPALRDMGVESCVSAAGIFVFAEIFSFGHFRNWFQDTLGTGGYQAWYYNSLKSYFIYDVDVSFFVMAQAFVTGVYLILLFKEKGTFDAVYRYGIPCLANMAGFCAANEYRFLSGGTLHEVSFSVLFVTILYEGVHLVCKLISGKSHKSLKQACFLSVSVVSLAWIVYNAKEEAVFFFITPKEGKYVEKMGGNLRNLYEDIDAAGEFLDGDAFFSTYASAQEIVEDKFQPSGTDYIIHVLGDRQREDYLDAFRSGDFHYAVTIQKNFSQSEYWVERANWFFYRELYRNWHPVFANTYELYWERNKEANQYTLTEPIDMTVERVNDATVKLIIQTDRYVDGFADVYIDYSVEKKAESRIAKLLIRRCLYVSNTGTLSADDVSVESNYLRDEGAEYIPMPIVDGYGELTLTATPDRCVNLNLRQAECKNIYTSYFLSEGL